MNSASHYAYISAKKVKHVNRFKKKEINGNSDLHKNSRSRSRSFERATEKELIDFSQQALKPSSTPDTSYEQEVDTNIVAIKLSNAITLQEPTKGILIKCKTCKAAMTGYSKKSFDSKARIWKCEFCNGLNKVNLSADSLPDEYDLAYSLGVADEFFLEEELPDRQDKDISVIFAIDVSGSMDEETQLNHTQKSKYQRFERRITRLECIKNAIDKQIEKIRNLSPDMKVGFVTFDENVSLIGDGGQPPVNFSGTDLYNYPTLLTKTTLLADQYMSKEVSASYNSLLEILRKIITGGSTALGPALLISIALAARGKRGSKVIICTDGLANTGLGKLNSLFGQDSKEFYFNMGAHARSKGISVSVISISKSECRLDMLSPIANLTGGDVIKVNPTDLTETFENLVSEKVLGSNVEIKLFLHKAMEFRNEDGKNLEDNNRVLVKKVGNATESSVVSAEFAARKAKEIAKLEDVNLEKMEKLPIQAQIQFTGKDDKPYIKILTLVQEVTMDKDEARKDANPDAIATHARIKTAELASSGDLKKAMTNAVIYSGLTTNIKEYQKNIASLYGAIQTESQMTRLIPDSQSDFLTTEINQALQCRKYN